MSDNDKKISPREAAILVLKKAEELYKASSLAKAEKPLEKKYEGFKTVEESARKSGASDPAAVAAAVGMKKYGKKNFEEHAHEGKSFKKDEDMQMSEEKNPDEKEDAELGEKVEQEVEQHEQENPEAEKEEHREKGSYKLAKFMGKMEMKKGPKPKIDKGM